MTEKEYMKMYYKKNKEKIKEYKHQYYLKNKERLDKINKKYIKEHPEIKKKIQKKYYYSHLEQIKESRILNKEYTKNYDKEYSIKNKEKIRKRARIYQQKRLEYDELYKFKRQIRNNIRTAFKKNNIIKRTKTEKIIGMSLNEFYVYLLKTYKQNYGIAWDKNIKVHIDHIIPLSTANNEEDVIKLCHYTNLQLLKAKDNLEKQSKLNWNIDKFFG